MTPATLRADRACADCRGAGYWHERHAPGVVERIPCDCALSRLSAAEADAAERFGYVVLSADEADDAGG